MEEIINVQFVQGGKSYSFLANGVLVKEGQSVVVEGMTGPAVATVVKANTMQNISSFQTPLKKVLRKATQKDIESYEKNNKEAKQIKTEMKARVKEFGLVMKVVDVYYSLDRSRLTVEYTAEDRVDFRDFIKELATIYKTRIEMKQIGARDEVKQMGGIGPCGKECCCRECLKEFEHVSVKMAKTQNLSLSPTKICGLCGRLMCCLAYENPYYAETQKLMPKVGSTISTPSGEGVVVSNDFLHRCSVVKIKQNDDTFVQKTFTIKQLRGEDPMVFEEDVAPQTEQKPTELKPEPTSSKPEQEPILNKKEVQPQQNVATNASTTKQEVANAQQRKQSQHTKQNQITETNKEDKQKKSKKPFYKKFYKNKQKKENV